MSSSLFKLCTEHAVYLMVWAFSHCNVPHWAYMTFDPHSGSGIILVPSCSRPLSLNVSSVHSMTSVTWTLTSLWRESTLMSCGPHLYCESILVLQATPHTLCREEGSGHAATIELACCDIIVLNDQESDLQGAQIWLVTSSFYCGVVTTQWLQRDHTLPLCEGVIPTRCIVHLHV